MNWMIEETGQFDPAAADRLGNKFLTGNGFIGYRGTLDEYSQAQKTATIVSGLYDRVGEQWREPVNLPNGGYIQVVYQGEALSVLSSTVLEHRQGLDLHDAVHWRETTFQAKDGARIRVSSRRFVSLARIPMLCVEFSVSADRDGEVEIHSGIDGDVWDINGPHLEEVRLESGEGAGLLALSAITHEKRVRVAVAEVVAAPGLAQDSLGGEAPRALRILRGRVGPQGITVAKFAAHVTGLEAADPLAESRRLVLQAAGDGFTKLLAEHTALWHQRWADCDIQIEGDPEAQEALRFSLYHLLAIVPTHTEEASIPARGMSGQMYKGAIFWDTEIFMLPFFSHAFPALARNLLLYRYHTLDGARRKAQEYGFRGAFYAWESQEGGEEGCTLFNITDVFTNRPMRTYFRDKQVHISADVAYAFWQYYSLSGDETIWLDGGAEVLFECARFFLSYAYYSPDKKRYEILDVTGPDEYHERVHNNAFTNRMAAHTFGVCLKVAANLRLNRPEFYAELVRRLDFEEDLSAIQQVSAGLFTPDAVGMGEIIQQFDGYFKLEDVALRELLARKQHPHEYLGGGNGLATTTQILKQADVVLMMFLFGERYPIETKAANWEFYEARTEHGSSLSACSYSLIAAQLGKVEWAYKYFMKTATIDLSGEGKQYVGTLYIGGTHPAGNGGAWMAAVLGLCGIRCACSTIRIQPHLPAHWHKVSLPLSFRGQKLRITITPDTVSVTPVEPLSARLFALVGETVVPLDASEETRVRMG